MSASLLPILLACAVCYVLAARFHGAFLSKALGVDSSRATPAVAKRDGTDFIPSKPYVLYAHHFAAIAGAGPIVGPTLAVAYGYVPVLIWVVLGAIFLGCVHDMATLYMSAREEGRSIADIARHYIGTAGYVMIVAFLVIGLFMITATFLNLSVTALTSMYPADKVGMEPLPAALLERAMDTPVDAAGMHPVHGHDLMPSAVKVVDGHPVQMARIGGIASTSVLVITLCAPLLGLLIYRVRTPAVFNYALAAVLCAGSILLGLWFPVVVTPDTWRVLMTCYVVLASAIPVWLLLMPRDFVNVQILYGGMAAVVAGLVVAGVTGRFSAMASAPHSVAEAIPAWNFTFGSEAVGLLWPMLMITVSCGAISGFHSLVCGGTSARQLANERDARTVGYNAMLLESILAVTVVATLVIGLNSDSYRHIAYDARNPILAIALATGNLMNLSFGVPVWAGAVLGILLLEGFVVTTLDVAVRLNRYLLEEVWQHVFKSPPAVLRNVWFNTALCVGIMFALSRSNTLAVLWQVFGSANQMMGAIALLVVTVWLRDNGRKYLFALIPAIVMFATTIASTCLSLVENARSSNWSLVATCGVLLFLGVSLAVIGFRALCRSRPATA